MASTAQTIPAKYLRVPAVAEIFDLSPKTIWNWIYAGQIESIVVGRSRRISPEAVQKVIDAGAQKSA
jgi:excisionase family DNA binding protein